MNKFQKKFVAKSKILCRNTSVSTNHNHYKKIGGIMYLFLGYLIVINLISAVVCCYDKLQAIRGKHRISEKSLLVLSVLGGSVAMYLTMCFIRHKTKHVKFMAGIPLIIALQIAVLLFILKNLG